METYTRTFIVVYSQWLKTIIDITQMSINRGMDEQIVVDSHNITQSELLHTDRDALPGHALARLL